MTATVQNLTADIGAVFKLEILHKDTLEAIIDYSSGWTGRFVLKYALCSTTDVEDATDTVTLTDGSSGVNIAVLIGKTDTLLWLPTTTAVYELHVWPDASPELVNILLKGTIVLKEGVG